MQSFKNKIFKNDKALAIAIALIIWQAIALLINNKILLVSPISVFSKLIEFIASIEFWKATWFSFYNITLGWIIAMLVGIVVATIANKFKIVDTLLWPYIVAMKATPVASFIILCLIWLSNKSLSIFTVFLIVFPIVYSNMYEAFSTVDTKLLEMAHIFKMSKVKQAKYIYLPHSMPYISSTIKISIGMAWKAGVAAEVIGLPNISIGTFLYEAKLYISTADLFAWTAIIIIVSMIAEKIILKIIELLYKKLLVSGDIYD